MMSGETNYAETRLNEYIEQIEAQINLILPIKNPLTPEIEEALSLTYDKLSSIESGECKILSYQLAIYSLYLQKITNKYRSIRRWAENSLGLMIGKYGQNYGDKWIKFDEKKFALIADNSHAKSLNDIWLK